MDIAKSRNFLLSEIKINNPIKLIPNNFYDIKQPKSNYTRNQNHFETIDNNFVWFKNLKFLGKEIEPNIYGEDEDFYMFWNPIIQGETPIDISLGFRVSKNIPK